MLFFFRAGDNICEMRIGLTHTSHAFLRCGCDEVVMAVLACVLFVSGAAFRTFVPVS